MSRVLNYDDQYRLNSISYAPADRQISPFADETAHGDHSPVPPRQLGSRVQQQSFTFDFLGNTKQSVDDVPAFYDRSLGTIANGALSQGPNQIVSASSSSGNLVAHYDAAGDLEDLVIVRNGTCASPDGKCTHRFAYEWDEVGRLSRVRRWDYVSIAPGEPVYPLLPTSTADVDLGYKYDASGIRVLRSKTAASGDQRYSAMLFGSLRLDGATWDSTGGDYERGPLTETVYISGLARVVHSNDPLPTLDGNPQHVLLLIDDPLGSMSSVVDQATGELVEQATYDGFGGIDSDYRPERWRSYREKQRFTGKEDDIEAGLVYFGSRYYNPALGRWISPDPLTVHGLASDPNPYAFVNSSPLRFVDTLGLDGDACLPPENICGGTGDPFGFEVGSGTPAGSPPGGASGGGVLGSTPVPTYRPAAAPPTPPPPEPPSGVVNGTNSSSVASAPPSAADWRSQFRELSRGRDLITGGVLALAGGAYIYGEVAATVDAVLNAESLVQVQAALMPVAQFAYRLVQDINGTYVPSGAAAPAQVTLNQQSGRSFQALGSAAVDVGENFALLQGGPITIGTVPDVLTEVAVGEFKNALKLSYTSQIQAQLNAAIASGRTYVLVTGMQTHVSEPLIKALENTNSIWVRFDPKTGLFIPGM